MHNPAVVLGLLLTVLASPLAANEIYKWVDEEGNVHFGDRPSGENAERMDIESRPTDPDRVQAEVMSRFETRVRKAEEKAEQEAEQPSAEERRAEAAEREKQCANYQIQLETYVNNRRLYRMSEDGEREYLTDDEIDQTREMTAQRVREYCQ